MSRFINPYNFVRCGRPSQRKPYVSVRRFDGLSGTITCEVRTLTPIFVGGPRDGDNQRLRFFKINGEPAIPASSLKGVIRSVAEAVSNSCFSIFDDRYILYRDIPATAKRAGIIRRNVHGNWFVEEVEEIVVDRALQASLRNVYQDGQTVWFRTQGKHRFRNRAVQVSPTQTAQCRRQGILKIYRKGPTGQQNIGFRIAVTRGTRVPVPAAVMEKYHRVIKHEDFVEGGLSRVQREYVEQLDDQFVYFVAQGGQVISIGKNFHYKWVREYSTRQLLERIHPDFLPCTSRQSLCFCCRLFGTVGEGENQQVAGRVMFEDAQIQSPYPPLQPNVVLRILGSPKPKYHPFYVTTDRQTQPKGLAGYDDVDSHLRGRKFYWHFPANSTYYRDPAQRLTGQNVQVELLPNGVAFTFKVHFSNLEEEELGLLLYVLYLDGPNGIMAHKLGMGKPLGLGSVKISITDLQARHYADRWRPSTSTSSNNFGYYISIFQTHLQQENDGTPFDQISNIADLNDILSTQRLVAPIEYPPPYGEGFRWFMEEKKQGYPQPLLCVEQTRDGRQTLRSHQT